jgi:hypothetical protein
VRRHGTHMFFPCSPAYMIAKAITLDVVHDGNIKIKDGNIQLVVLFDQKNQKIDTIIHKNCNLVRILFYLDVCRVTTANTTSSNKELVLH